MNLRSSVIVEHQKGDHLYRLELPVGVGFQDAYEAVLEIGQAVVTMAKQTEAAKQAAEKSAEQPVAQ